MSHSPSGRQLGIIAGPYRAVVTQTGATLRTVAHAGEELLDGFAEDELPDGCRGQVLVPWPNRLRDGRWRWQGQDLQLPVDEPTKGNSASHGLVRRETWTVERHEQHRVELSHRLRARPGYPFSLDVTAGYEVDPVRGMTARIVAVNAGDAPAPVAMGAHPYLRPPGGGPIDEARLRLPASTRVLADEWGIPAGEEQVHGTPFDFREGRRIGLLAVNHAFTDLACDESGRASIDLSVDDGRTVSLWAGPSCRWLQVFTGDTLDPAARRRGVAVEPMTAPAGALASGMGLAVLAPGASLELLWGLSFTTTR